MGIKAIGEIRIADNVKVSSMSFVNKNIDEKGSLYGEVAAKSIKNFDR